MPIGNGWILKKKQMAEVNKTILMGGTQKDCIASL